MSINIFLKSFWKRKKNVDINKVDPISKKNGYQ